MKDNILTKKLKWSAITAIGGLLIGVGVADCIIAMNKVDLNQIARGITIFSAGLTILVIIDNSKTQRATEEIQKNTLQRLEHVENQLQTVQQSQQKLEAQIHEMKEMLRKPEEISGDGH